MNQPRSRAPLTGFLFVAFVAIRVAAPAVEPIEYQIKAAFLLNFTKFVQWPTSAFETPDSPIRICILGQDPFGRVLDQIVEGETVDGRKVTTQRIEQAPPPGVCQVVFLPKPENDVKEVPEFGPGVLTVSDDDRGMIAFVIENRRVRFRVKQTAAEDAGLRLSSKLLSVAKSVEK